MKYLFLIWSNLWRKRLRTWFTLFSIAVAFILFGFLAAIQLAFSQGVEVAGADRLVSRHKVSIIQTLPESYGDRILRIPGVDGIVHGTWFGGIYQDPKNFFPNMAMVPDKFFDIYPEYKLDKASKERWLKTRSGAIVGSLTAKRFGFKVGDIVPLNATIYPKSDGSMLWEFEICGIYEGEKKGVDTSQFFFRYDYLDESLPENQRGQVGWYVLRVKDPDQAGQVAQAIDREFANSYAETKTETEGAFVTAFAKQAGDIGAIMRFVLICVFFTILLVAGNTMSQSVRERTAELAVLKAMGFAHSTVLGLVFAEAFALCIVGGGVGLGLAYLMVGSMDVGSFFPVFYIPTRDLVLGIVCMVAMGLLTGVLPALQAMNLRIADGLRR